MNRYRRGVVEDEQDDHEALWHELAERICHVPGWEMRPGDPQRAFHHDLPGMREEDLTLERERALVRACMERDRLDRAWLLQRIARIDAERACREERQTDQPAAPPRPAMPRQAPASLSPAQQLLRQRQLAEAERDVEWLQHQEWLRFQRESREEA